MLKVKSNFLRNFFVCVLIAFACLFGYLMLQNLCAELVIAWGWEERTTTGSLFEDGFLSAFLVIAIIFPVLEELIFRLFVCKSLQKLRLNGWHVIVVSAVIFMLYHWSWSQVVYQLLMGIWLAWIYMKTHQIGWTVLIHFINNAFINILISSYNIFPIKFSGRWNSIGRYIIKIFKYFFNSISYVFCIIRRSHESRFAYYLFWRAGIW